MTQEPGVGPELDIATVLDAIAARHPDTECLVFRDRRLTWSEVSAHTDRLAGHLLAQGLGAAPSEPTCRVTSPARTTWPSTSTTASSTSRSCSAAGRPGWRRSTSTTATSPRSCSTSCSTPAPRPSSCTRASRRRWPRSSPTLPALRVIVQVPDDSGHDLLPGAVWFDDALAGLAGDAVRRRPERRRPLHPLHRRDDRHAQGRAVAQRRRHDRVLRRLADGPHARRLPGRDRRRDEGADHAAVHARRRPLGRPVGCGWAAARSCCRRRPSTSTRPTCGASSSASASSSC